MPIPVANLRKLRNSKKMTQEELAKVLHFGTSTISDWEIGRTEPDLSSLIKLADFFKVSIDYLMNNKTQELEETIEKTKISLKDLDKKHLITIIEKQLDLLIIIQKAENE